MVTASPVQGRPSTSSPSENVGAPAVAAESVDAIDDAEFRSLVERLSESGGEFISDNYLSNEASYLQVAPGLRRHAPSDGVYIGVGPEQNFSYIALTRPALAFIVDIRRANQLLHLLYKAAFERARGRAHFLALMLARPLDPEREPKPSATLERVIATVRQSEPTQAEFDRSHRELVDHLSKTRGLRFDDADLGELRRAHEAFFRGQFQLAFELKQNSTRTYPTLEDLLLARDPSEEASGFLASVDAFRAVARLHRQNKIIPIVGDFAGTHALQRVADEIRRRGLVVSAFYVSNVEQYLLGDADTWKRWSANLLRLPSDERTLIIRAYLDQGSRHPRQLPGQRSATVLQRLDSVQRELMGVRPRNLLALTTRGALLE
jgi:hypothetical protein